MVFPFAISTSICRSKFTICYGLYLFMGKTGLPPSGFSLTSPGTKKTGQVIGDELNLQPDPFGLVEAATELVKMGFKVFPYCIEDWILCRRLMDVGCEVLMPWAAPIGSGQGPRNFRALQELRERTLGIPLIVDAGIGLPSQACQVMEWGFDGILLNTAVSRSIDPVSMAGAFANAVRAGRGAFLAGPMVVQEAAVCSTPDIGRPFAQLSTRATRKLK